MGSKLRSPSQPGREKLGKVKISHALFSLTILLFVIVISFFSLYHKHTFSIIFVRLFVSLSLLLCGTQVPVILLVRF